FELIAIRGSRAYSDRFAIFRPARIRKYIRQIPRGEADRILASCGVCIFDRRTCRCAVIAKVPEISPDQVVGLYLERGSTIGLRPTEPDLESRVTGFGNDHMEQITDVVPTRILSHFVPPPCAHANLVGAR